MDKIQELIQQKLALEIVNKTLQLAGVEAELEQARETIAKLEAELEQARETIAKLESQLEPTADLKGGDE